MTNTLIGLCTAGVKSDNTQVALINQYTQKFGDRIIETGESGKDGLKRILESADIAEARDDRIRLLLLGFREAELTALFKESRTPGFAIDCFDDSRPDRERFQPVALEDGRLSELEAYLAWREVRIQPNDFQKCIKNTELRGYFEPKNSSRIEALQTQFEDPSVFRRFLDLNITLVEDSFRDVAWIGCLIHSRNSRAWWTREPGVDLPLLVFDYTGPHAPPTLSIEDLTGVSVFPAWMNQDGSEPDHPVRQIVDRLAKDSRGSIGKLDELPSGITGICLCYGLDLHTPDAAELCKLERCISRILTLLMQKSRICRYYECRFYMPFFKTGDKDGLECEMPEFRFANHAPADRVKEAKAGAEAEADAQAFWYFLPQAREFLFNLEDSDSSETDSIREWRITPEKSSGDISGDSLVLGQGGGPEDDINGIPIRATITDKVLYRYYNGIHILTVNARPDALEVLRREHKTIPVSLFSDSDDWWLDLVFCDRERLQRIQELQISHWLRFTKLARILYPTFIEQKQEDKIDTIFLKSSHSGTTESFPTEKGQPLDLEISANLWKNLSPVVLQFMAEFFECTPEDVKRELKSANYEPFADDRMFTNVSYGIAGQYTNSDAERDWLERYYSLALFVDTPSDTFSSFNGYAYDPVCIEKQDPHHTLRRWASNGYLYGFTRYSNAYMGFGGFFNDRAGPRHVARIYHRMLLQALFCRESLLRFSRQISEETPNLENDTGGKHSRAFMRIRTDFITFTNRFWFNELTLQIQGQEIFELQKKNLMLEQEFDFIKEELAHAHDILERADAEKDADFQKNIEHFGFGFAVFAILLGYFTYLKDLSDALHEKIGCRIDAEFSGILCCAVNAISEGYMAVQVITIAILTGVTILFLLYKLVWKPLVSLIRGS